MSADVGPIPRQFARIEPLRGKCEAQLARLAQRNPHICTVPKFEEAFVCLRQKTATTKRMDTYLSKAAVTDVELRINRLLNSFRNGTLPWTKRRAGDKGK